MQSNRQSAITSLAIVGFVALLALGIWAAVYSARFIPTIANRIGAAAVYVGSAFSPAGDNEPGLSVVPTATSTIISFGTTPPATTTVATTTAPVVTPKPVIPTPVTPGPRQEIVVVTTGPVAPTPYGRPDLVVTVGQIGYLRTSSTDSFVGSRTVPDGERPAVKFTVKNIGTNWTGTWRFSAEIPTRTAYTYRSDAQQSLAPGDSIDYVIGFDRARSGDNRVMTITVNYNNAVLESNTNNNEVEIKLDIE